MKTLTVVGGNLFRIAADQLGDATQWIRVAQLNGVVDPILSGTMTLILPDTDPTATGGIVRQS